MAYTAAAMYGGAAMTGAIETFLPGDPKLSLVGPIGSLVVVAALLLWGPRLPRWALAGLGPIGVVMIANALVANAGPGDDAVLYVWPVFWSALFFGRRGAIGILACVGVAHAVALLVLPPADSFPARWVDVMVCVTVVCVVVLILVERNERLLGQLADEARTDALTGLLNRRGFDERAALELAHARRESRSIALAAFDIDHFKRVNDEWGHEVGDRVLARTGRLLVACSRDVDVAARLGGEEFVMLLPGSDAADADAFTQRVREALAQSGDSELPHVRVSAGVVASSAAGDIEAMLRGADMALYKAKRAGRDQTVSLPELGWPDVASTTRTAVL